VPAYERFSTFYDVVMDDPAPRAARVARCIDAYLPGASSLLELGCGTGSILARLTSVPRLTGLDRSPEMLDLARAKVPDARLVEGDMESFAFDERFDVVICVFDSLNHLLTFDAWQSMFRAVHDHLVDGGLFIFDVNTVGELRRLGEEPPWVYDFDGGVAIMDVTFADDGASQVMSQWDVRIFEDLGSSRYHLHHEQIGELGVGLAHIASALEDRFTLLEQVDEHDHTPTDESMKAYFCLRRVPSPDLTHREGT
jgi:SAM-dependent methyltransferase